MHSLKIFEAMILKQHNQSQKWHVCAHILTNLYSVKMPTRHVARTFLNLHLCNISRRLISCKYKGNEQFNFPYKVLH